VSTKADGDALVKGALLSAILAGWMALGVAPSAAAQPAGKASPHKPPYSPHAGHSFPSRVFFGDTHLHTSFSIDAGAAGARLAPRDAYRFAKGEETTSSSGQRVKLARPLDFLVVADHSDGFGLFPLILAGDPRIMADPQGRRWHEMIRSGQGVEAALDIVSHFAQGTISKAILPVPGTEVYRGAWERIIQAAEEANEPGRFTAFIGYEWTSTTGGNNLHRNVVFRDGAARASRVEPFTVEKPLGSDDPRDLWRWMAAYEEKTGGQVLAIAHNGNLSNGRMFPIIESFTDKRIDREYAETRAHWEPLYEVTQIKGDGETHPLLSPNDEFADFERWDTGNLHLSELKKPEMLEFEYARAALRNGLALEQELGTNPYKFGLIGSTDSHTGLSTADDDNFFGKTAGAEPRPERASHPFVKNAASGRMVKGWETIASGYAAVWATENTREAIWDAMERKETYATTGPRMLVRFFGGWDFEAEDAHTRSPATAGYSKGVPMGGDLTNAPEGRSPGFLVAALKDPIGANLDRIQIVKGWVDASGETQERVHDVAVSDGRKIDPDGRCKTPVGSSVDVANATWTNTIGASELIAVWEDPDFDPSLRAFYYARVIEIPTPRWTAYDAKYFGIRMPKEVRMTTTERAYTSPIWYTP
jgi:hypothetical protein